MQARRGELVDVLDGPGLVAELVDPVGAVGGVDAVDPVDPGDPGGGVGAVGAGGGVQRVGRPDHRVGVITWQTEPGDSSAEIRCVAVDAALRGRGIGRALCAAAHDTLARTGVGAAWLVTTNDNEPAIRLYESPGYAIAEIRRGAVDEIRRTIKPSVPLVGHGGVAMRDEVELSKGLRAG